MELHHHRFVLGTNRPDVDLLAAAQTPRQLVLGRIGPDGRFGEVLVLGRSGMQHDARVERQQALGRGQQRVDVDLLDPRLLDHELAEADEQLFQAGEVHRRAATHAFERLVDLRLFHHAARERRGQRR